MFRPTLNSGYTASQERITVVSRGLPVDAFSHIEVYRLRYIDGRPQSFLEPNAQPDKPPVLICPPVLIPVQSSGSSMPSRAKRTPPKTLLFPGALPLLTLPITMPLIFAHIYLKQHPVPRAEPNDSS